MADYVVHRGTTAKLGRIEGDLKVGHGAKIEASEGDLVYVTGAAVFEGSAEIRCDFRMRFPRRAVTEEPSKCRGI